MAIDTAVQSGQPIEPNLPFPVTEKSIMWLEATTDKADTEVTARFSGELINHVDH